MVSGLLSGIAGGATVAITIKAIDEFSAVFNKASIGAKGLSTAVALVSTAAITAGASLVAIGKSAFDAAANFEQTEIAFTTMLGSAEMAQDFLKELTEFAKKTPFTLPGVEKSARQLLAVGFNAEEIIPTLKSVGDVAAGLGLGESGLERLILNLGQVRTQGKLTGRELRDFAVAGVPLLETLADQLGVTTVQIQDMVSAGEISSDVVIKAFESMSSGGGRFADLMGKQAETVSGKISNLKDSFSVMARELGKLFLPAVKQVVDVFINNVIPAIQPFIPLLGEYFSEVIKGVIPIIEEFAVYAKEAAEILKTEWLPHVKEIIPYIAELGKEVLGAAFSIFKELIPAVKEYLPLGIEIIETLIAAIPLFIDLSKIILNLSLILLKILIPIMNATLKIIQFILKVIEPVVEFFGDLIEAVKDLFRLTKTSVKKSEIKLLESTTYTTPSSSANNYTFNIENINGTDPTQMAEAFQKELNIKIR